MNHGTFLHIAHEEVRRCEKSTAPSLQGLSPRQWPQGLIKNTSIHAGIRAPLIRRKGDLRNDRRCGFDIVTARDIDRLGAEGVIGRIKDRVGDSMVYISVDIDVLDPAFAPGKSRSPAADRRSAKKISGPTMY